MNKKVIVYVLGTVLKIEGALMVAPFIIGLIYHEKSGLLFALCALICAACGVCLVKIGSNDFSAFYLKDGCIATALSWLLMSLFGCIPFILTGEIPSFIDAFFETVSGFTTTGASILSDVEALSHASLFWRSLTHWIGGMGVLVFLLAIIPLSGGSNMNLMKSESPGPSVGKLAPKVRTTATILYVIYFILSGVQFLLLIFFEMPLFDAACITFGTAGTGGFGVRNSSVADYNVICQWIITVFMVLFGINFSFYFYIYKKDIKRALSMNEVRTYIAIIISAIVVVFLTIGNFSTGIMDRLLKSSFQVASIISSTGFSTDDFNLWPSLAKTVLILLMIIGACAGSTGGGVKVSRVLLMGRDFLREISSYAHPKSVKKIKVDGQAVEGGMLRTVNVYLATFAVILAASVIVISIEGYDFETNFTSALSCLNNIGPGMSLTGAASNYGFLSPLSKGVLIFDMLAGRLELFPVLMLFHPAIWSMKHR